MSFYYNIVTAEKLGVSHGVEYTVIDCDFHRVIITSKIMIIIITIVKVKRRATVFHPPRKITNFLICHRTIEVCTLTCYDTS